MFHVFVVKCGVKTQTYDLKAEKKNLDGEQKSNSTKRKRQREKKPKLPGPHKEGKEGAKQTLIQGTEETGLFIHTGS